jgi:predicted GNAT family acetyltransferase
MDEISVTRHDHGSSGEYHAAVAGSSAIGRLTWTERATCGIRGARAAEHTLVPSEIGGRGVAAKLVEALVHDAREQGFKIDPQCSYVAAAFKRHPDWADLHV